MRSRRGIGALAVCGLVLGMMAISASGAQAGQWMINGSNVSGELTVSASVELEGGGATLLSTSGGNAVAITCTTASVTNAVVAVSTITGSIIFSGCTTKINGALSTTCVPKGQPIAAGNKIVVVLHDSEPYVKITGKEFTVINKGKIETVLEPIATLKFSCAALPATVKVTGTGWIKDCTIFEFETEKATHLLEEGRIPAKVLEGLFFGANTATIDGSANVAFSDATHHGMTFSGLAE